MRESLKSDINDLRVRMSDAVTSEKCMAIYVISFMITIPVVELISQFNGVIFGVSEYMITVFSVIGLFLCSLNLYLNNKRHWSDFFFITLHIFMFLSLIFSSNMGSLQEVTFIDIEFPHDVIAYYCAMFAAFRLSSFKYRKNVVFTFIGVSILQFTVGIFQSFGIRIIPPQWELFKDEITHAMYGITQNSNYYGGLTVLLFGLFTSLFIFAENKSQKVISGILLVISTYCTVNSMARLAWIGDLFVFVFFAVSATVMIRMDRSNDRYRVYLKRFLFSFVFILTGVLLSIANPYERTAILDKLFKFSDEANKGVGELGSSRLYIWRFCLESIPKHWVTGIGFSNILQCFFENPNYIPRAYTTTHAHNVYLHILTTQGVFSFINYMTFLIISVVKAVKKIINTDDNKERILTWTFLAMFTGYAVASFFNCRISYIEFYFYIVIGLMNPISVEARKRPNGALRKAG